MIIGMGIDIVENMRIKKILDNRKGFLKKVFSHNELEVIDNNNIEKIAGRFAAKEAFVKALGIGFGKIKLVDVEILNDEYNKPYLFINDKIKTVMAKYNLSNIHISISHEKNYSVANCIIE